MARCIRRFVCLVVVAAAVVGVRPASAQTPTVAVVTETTLMFLVPDARRDPLLRLEAGVEVTVIRIEDDWVNIRVEGSQWGTRVGYVERKRLRFTEAAPPSPQAAVAAKPAVPLVTASDVAAAKATAGASAPAAHAVVPSASVTAAAAPVAPPPVQSAAAAAVIPKRVEMVPLGSIHRIFLEKMANDLDQYISAEITKQFKGTLTVVLDKANADAVLRGIDENHTGVGAAITGRYLGLHDNASASITLVDPGESVVLWASEAGDRSLMFGVMARGGQRKVASRLVSNLKKAIERAR